MLRTLGTEFLTGLKALKESSDVLGLCLLLTSREQLRAPPCEGWVLPQCHGERLLKLHGLLCVC